MTAIYYLICMAMVFVLTHSFDHSLTVTGSLEFTFTLIHSIPLSPSLRHTFTFTHKMSIFTHSIPLSRSLTHSLSPSLTHSFTFTHKYTHLLDTSLSVTHLLVHFLSQVH